MSADFEMQYFSEFKSIRKDFKIIKSFLDCFWNKFIELNKESISLVFLTRTQLVECSSFKRRNAFKHLLQLIFNGIFLVQGNKLIPSAFIFKINNQIYNPSKFFLEKELPFSLNSIIKVKPKNELFGRLISLIKVNNKQISSFVRLPVKTESYKFGSYYYKYLPLTSKCYSIWNQEDPLLNKKETELENAIHPIKNPFDFKMFFSIGFQFNSPFIRLDESVKEFVLTGKLLQANYDGIHSNFIGDYNSNIVTNSFIEFYDRHKKLISSKPFGFPQSKNSIPLISRTLYSCLPKHSNNEDFIGYYLFKNNYLRFKFANNHYLVSFAKFETPNNTKFVRFKVGEGSFLTVLGITALKDFPIDFVQDYMKKINSSDFIQNTLTFSKLYDVPGIDLSKFITAENLLKKAFFNADNDFLDYFKKCIKLKQDFLPLFREQVLNLIKTSKPHNDLLKLVFSVDFNFLGQLSALNSFLSSSESSKYHEIARNSLKDSLKFCDKLISRINVFPKEDSFYLLDFITRKEKLNIRNNDFVFVSDINKAVNKLKNFAFSLNAFDRDSLLLFRLRVLKGFAESLVSFRRKHVVLSYIYKEISRVSSDFASLIEDYLIEKTLIEEQRKMLGNTAHYLNYTSMYNDLQSLTNDLRKLSEEKKIQELNITLKKLNEFSSKLF